MLWFSAEARQCHLCIPPVLKLKITLHALCLSPCAFWHFSLKTLKISRLKSLRWIPVSLLGQR
ncbi:hypothetical protein ACHAXS_002040 [Conticribra weissflogii]